VPSNPGLGDALQGTEGVLFLTEDDEAFLNSVREPLLAELEPGNVAVQIGRIFRARRARLPSCRCWRRQVLLRSQGRELVGLWRHHDDLGHRSDGYEGPGSPSCLPKLSQIIHNPSTALDEICNLRDRQLTEIIIPSFGTRGTF